MLENIIFAILAIAMTATGVWVWWLESHGQTTDNKEFSDKKRRIKL